MVVVKNTTTINPDDAIKLRRLSMKIQDALKLHNGDEVTVKKTKQVMRVIEVEVTPKEHTTNNMTCIDVKLEDGNWYGYKEIS